MVDAKSLDLLEVITTLLRDISYLTRVFTPRSLRLTECKLKQRYEQEGIGFLTKTLPSLAKSLDRALAGDPFDPIGWSKPSGSKLPRFLGELFEQIFTREGVLLDSPNVSCIKHLRQILYLFYKYELPYEDTTAQQCLDLFVKTDEDIPKTKINLSSSQLSLARSLLRRVLSTIDFTEIAPRHGPGSVSGKETYSGKYRWARIPRRTSEAYPIDSYYYASLGHVADSLQEMFDISESEPSARVVLVPKDSRGPRIISCEPKEFQWLQQGIMRALVKRIETCSLTRGVVNFTNQQFNRDAALEGSVDGRYATLDLKEASDRISTRVVELLWPEESLRFIMSCRSKSTVLPCGQVLNLNKFAPMGSALCFPVLALTVWAVLHSGGIPKDAILVYGDDVIVPREVSGYAMKLLESVGLLVNKSKSCTNGLFRESCGMDAFAGIDVTPVRLRTVWSSRPAASPYMSWIAYANQFHACGYVMLANFIASKLSSVYGALPGEELKSKDSFACLSFDISGIASQPDRRWNTCLQRHEYKVYVEKPQKIVSFISGWQQLLRFFTEGCDRSPLDRLDTVFRDRWSIRRGHGYMPTPQVFQASVYTVRRRSKLVRMWR